MTDQQERVETHTTEPWKAEFLSGGCFSVDGGPNFYYPVCSRGSPVDHMEAECHANARRIVACVNACKAIETEILENGVEGGGALNLAAMIEAARHVDRADEAEALLVEAGPLLQDLLEEYESEHPNDRWTGLQNTRAFLAKMEARKP